LIAASSEGHVEVLRFLLGHPGAKASVNHRAGGGATALWVACCYGRGALLESGADPTIADNNGLSPVTVAKNVGVYPPGVTAEGRRECAEALEVSSGLAFPLPQRPSS
jgi:hypothetical protein